jgi:TrmH family RNA methyltransferase
VINATMGSFARVQLHYTNLEETLAPHKNRLYACTMDGEPVYGLKNLNKPIVIIGNEGRGVSEGLLQLAQHKTGIPRRGGAESLNAAVATAIVVDNMSRLCL